MLELRPNCEICDRDLPPESPDARICSYECTYCADCAETGLKNVCPNCGGNLEPRPIRPAQEWRPGVGLSAHPASDKRRHSKWSAEDRATFSERVGATPPNRR